MSILIVVFWLACSTSPEQPTLEDSSGDIEVPPNALDEGVASNRLFVIMMVLQGTNESSVLT